MYMQMTQKYQLNVSIENVHNNIETIHFGLSE